MKEETVRIPKPLKTVADIEFFKVCRFCDQPAGLLQKECQHLHEEEDRTDCTFEFCDEKPINGSSYCANHKWVFPGNTLHALQYELYLLGETKKVNKEALENESLMQELDKQLLAKLDSIVRQDLDASLHKLVDIIFYTLLHRPAPPRER